MSGKISLMRWMPGLKYWSPYRNCIFTCLKENIMKKQIGIITLLIALWLSLTATALAQGPYDGDWHTVAGGSDQSNGSVFTVHGTAGQAETGNSSGITFTVKSGFWPAAIYRASAGVTVPPALQSTNPISNSHTAPLTTTVSVTYDQNISATTVNTKTFAIHAMQTGQLTQTYSVNSGEIKLTPTNAFKPGELVQVSATAGTLNITGTHPVSPTVWQFRTAVVGGSGVFTDSEHSFLSDASSDVAFGDVDGDGDLDAYVTNKGTPDRVYENDGAGNFTDSGQSLGTTEHSSSVSLGDVDGDGDLDAFITVGQCCWSSQPSMLWLNDGAGIFTDSGQSLASGTNQDSALGDLDGDGDLDAFLVAYQTNIVVLWNDGNGVFTDSGQAWASGEATSVDLGDVDSDGDLDAFVFRSGTSFSNILYINDGSGNFSPGQTLGNGAQYVGGGALGDLDGDGDLDAFEVYRFGGHRVWTNDGTGTFTDSGQSLPGSEAHNIVLGDLDGDGDLDAFVAQRTYSNYAFFNDGNGIFSGSAQTLGISHTVDIDLGDVDGDGDLDVFAANGASLAVVNSDPNRLWLNQNPINNAPTFTSSPVITATENAIYSYSVVATDADAGDVLTITAFLKPAWLSVSTTFSGTATLSGTPAGSDTGSHGVSLLVTDSGGLTDTQDFTVTVVAIPLPDLTISSLGLTPNTVCRGEPTTIGFTESNSGTVNAGAHVLSFYNDDAAAGYVNSIGSFPLNSLAAGGNININLAYTTRTTGTRYIKVLADATSVITESNESNNGNFGVLTVTDDPAPVGTIVVNNGAAYTSSTGVSLTLNATDSGICATSVSQMRFAYNGLVTGWEPFAATKNLVLNALDGDKVTIYVQYKDEHGNASNFIGKSITLDDTPPASTVTAPNGNTDSASFTVFWSGTDNASGLKHFDIQMNDSGNGWLDWQTSITATNALFSNAQVGHTYCFRARAEDNVGNVEPWPGEADACINVQALIEGKDLTIEKVEFTQAVQNQSNSVPLVANRPLLARVTVGLGTDITPIDGVTAKLHVFRNGQELSGSPLLPENGPITAKATPDINSATELLHFRFPIDWLVGTLQVYLEVDPDSAIKEMDEGNNRYPAADFETLTFNETYGLEVTIVPIIWDRNGQIMTVSPADIADLLGYVKRSYPLAEATFTVHNAHRYSGASIDWVKLLYEIKDIREIEQPRPASYQKYYGLIPYPPDFSSGTVGLGFRPGTAAIGYAGPVIGGDETAAHEIGHNFGRKHVSSTDPGCGVPANLDPEYPYPNGIINYPGWDFGLNRIIPNSYHDYMSYCRDTWISDYTYRAIYDKIVATPSTQLMILESSTDGILVRGQISNDGSAGQLASTFVLSDTAAIYDSRGGDFRLALVDSSDTEVYVYAFDPPELTVETLNGVTSNFSYLLPAHSDITAIRLYYQNNLLDELSAGTPPAVNITSAIPATLPPDEYTLAWAGNPSDLTYLVRFSADKGATWTTLTPPISATSYTVDVTTLPGTTAGMFEVSASSGLESASVKSADFAVGTKIPQTAIQGPESGQLFAVGETITLLGGGYDFEDGILSNNQFSWFSDRDGELGQGSTLAVSNLSRGSHTITFRATDSNNQTGESQIQISVGAADYIYLPLILK